MLNPGLWDFEWKVERCGGGGVPMGTWVSPRSTLVEGRSFDGEEYRKQVHVQYAVCGEGNSISGCTRGAGRV